MTTTAQKETLLSLLQHNARLSVEEIGERLMLSPQAIAATLDAWEKDQTILGYHAVVRDSALPKQTVRAMIEVSVEPERDAGFDRTARSIAKFPEVTDLMLVSGNYDLLLFVGGENLQEVANFVASKLASLRGVRSTRTHFMLKRYKESGFQAEENESYERLSVSP
jgi:DNA-binding Lrp family transcriptional regulator